MWHRHASKTSKRHWPLNNLFDMHAKIHKHVCAHNRAHSSSWTSLKFKHPGVKQYLLETGTSSQQPWLSRSSEIVPLQREDTVENWVFKYMIWVSPVSSVSFNSGGKLWVFLWEINMHTAGKWLYIPGFLLIPFVFPNQVVHWVFVCLIKYNTMSHKRKVRCYNSHYIQELYIPNSVVSALLGISRQ